VDDWLTRARDALASEAGLDPATLELSGKDSSTLRELARIAAHDSRERINAPLLFYLVGRAQSSLELDELAEAFRRSTS
jgi:hypothetical protein